MKITEKNLVETKGIEPPTLCLQSRRSTTELRPQEDMNCGLIDCYS